MTTRRQSWGSKIGIILAVAGSAVGLGNFLRFPVQAAQNGGGAFMIPYFIALMIVGIPLMWIEWTAGRYGGGFGHGTAPGIFHTMTQKNRFIKYFGVIGIFGPLVIFIYYTYIESWLLGFTILSLTSKYSQAIAAGEIGKFFSDYLSVNSVLSPAYIFFIITFIINFIIIYLGVKSGIEKVAKFAMPLLLILGIILVIRVLTLGTPDPAKPAWSITNGLGFLWNPDFAALKNPRVWLAAAGQVFFTLSVGIGVILTYASYLKEEDDVVLSGLTASATNEFAEIILGGSLIIPAAFAFFGPDEIVKIATSGTFSLGFITMPVILSKVPMATIFAFVWFLLLFLAGVTSSISLLQTPIAFLEDEFNMPRKKSVTITGIVSFVLTQPAIFFLANGVVDELDFWGGTFALVLFGTIEAVLFSWVFGIDKAWDEVHKGAQMEIPGFYKFIIKYITPTFLIAILIGWFIKDGWPVIIMQNVPEANKTYILATRLGLLALFFILAVLVKIAWRKRKSRT
ncbi:MAG: sodium-dependent transporter [Elusimicrobia bacterium]|nr:sodium-dependent transporter [Elusimicrobiota bacterium]